MNIGSWIGQAVIGQELAHLAHSMIVHTLLQLGYTRPEFHLRCAYKTFRPTSTGQTHFALALRLTCNIFQKVTS